MPVKEGGVGVAPDGPGFLRLFVSSRILVLMKGHEGPGEELGWGSSESLAWDMAKPSVDPLMTYPLQIYHIRA